MSRSLIRQWGTEEGLIRLPSVINSPELRGEEAEA
jgi:hypothetical protein